MIVSRYSHYAGSAELRVISSLKDPRYVGWCHIFLFNSRNLSIRGCCEYTAVLVIESPKRQEIIVKDAEVVGILAALVLTITVAGLAIVDAKLSEPWTEQMGTRQISRIHGFLDQAPLWV